MKKLRIPWKKAQISLKIEDIAVSAIIVWWAKDYYIEILEPSPSKISGEHMMLSIPCKYVLKNADKRKEVAILDRCIEKIKKHVQEITNEASY